MVNAVLGTKYFVVSGGCGQPSPSSLAAALNAVPVVIAVTRGQRGQPPLRLHSEIAAKTLGLVARPVAPPQALALAVHEL